MTLKMLVLADACIFIDLDRFQFFDLLRKLSDFYGWEICITAKVEEECKNRFTASRLKTMIRDGDIKVLRESKKEITRKIARLSVLTPFSQADFKRVFWSV